MERKSRIDLFGGSVLVVFSIVLGLNQVMIKVVNDGLQPVFQSGLRSACAFVIVLAYALWRRKRLNVSDGTFWPGMGVGILFAIEFIALFLALDYTTVSRTSIFFYSMPVWLTIAAHFLISDDRLTLTKALGMLLAMAGIIWVMTSRDDTTSGTLLGDLLCIVAAICWASIALMLRLTKLKTATIEMQLLYQLAVSTLILIPASLFFGPWIRELEIWHLGVFAFQVIGVVSIGFLVWFWILSIYPAPDMASFGFLAPVFGVIFGWVLLGEDIDKTIIGALVLVSAGIVLINMRRKVKDT